MRIAWVLVPIIVVGGCGSPPDPANPLAGTWEYRDPKVKNAPEALIYRLRILEDGSYLMGGGMSPVIIGKATLKGSEITLTPTSMPGAPPEMAKGADSPLKPTFGTLAQGAGSLTIRDTTSKAESKFTKRVPVKVGPRTVNEEEAPHVGRYAADVDWSKVADEGKAMLKALQPFFSAELREDNTFLLDVTFPMSGTWNAVKGKPRLKFTFKDVAQSVEMDVKGGILSIPPAPGSSSPYFFKKIKP